MRKLLLAAVSCAALATVVAVPAAASPLAPTPARLAAETATDTISDAELRSFVAAMEAVRPIAAAAGSSPTAEQQIEMAAAIEASGLDLDRFNTISVAVSGDRVVRARAELAAMTPSPAGSPAAAVTDVEIDQFIVAMEAVRPIAESLNGTAPTAEQQGQMAAAIEASGLDLQRFNAISGAVSGDAYLRARLAVSGARRNS